MHTNMICLHMDKLLYTTLGQHSCRIVGSCYVYCWRQTVLGAKQSATKSGQIRGITWPLSLPWCRD